ncbi:MAG: thrombospondin type 3 repeat-containing protein [Anaerolineales bacterium]
MSGKRNLTPILLFLALLVLLALGGLVALGGGSFLEPATPEEVVGETKERLSVSFTAPQSEEQIAVGHSLMVHTVANGDGGITRVELWVGDRLHAAQDSTLPGGTSPFPLVSAWQPPAAGTYTLIVRAFGAGGARVRAAVDVEAVDDAPVSDGDGDGVSDELDACPDQPGWHSTGGCPDGDGDTVPDGEDACPDEAGAPEMGGCLAPAAGDRDGDGLPDSEDACPDQPGPIENGGCPLPGDRDGDGIPDEEDGCPDVPGAAETGGCPDRDGDTLPDGEDPCPDEAGPPESGCPAPAAGDRDGDGLPDGEDGCPDEPGPPENGGCPVPEGDPGGGGPGGDGEEDADGDGVPDAEDPCPAEPGPPELDGCPDSDGDGIPDWWDRCPDEPGVPEAAGCPESDVVGDRDGDGAPDDVDLCPDEAGEPEHGGCPPPEEEEEETEGLDEIDPGLFFEEVQIPVEFQALNFRVSDDYDGVYCYPSLNEGPVERYTFEPLGAQQWDIAAELGSRTLLNGLSQPIEVQMECGADVVFMGPEGGWGTYWSIGSIERSHPASDWDGHVITVRSEGGEDGRWFEVQYRLCTGSCDNTAFPAPMALLDHGRDDLLIWQWDGDLERLAYYDVYRDGSRIVRMAGDEAAVSISVAGHAPLCGGRREFYVVAVGADGRESPPSNRPVWEVESCPRVVRVTFEALGTHNLGGDERWADGESVGPIGGNFWATGSSSEQLDFIGVDYPEWAGGRIRGYRLRHWTTYSVQAIFDQIWTWVQGSMSSPYRAPDRDYVTVELGPGDDLTFGGYIYDADTGNPSDTLFDGQLTLPAAEVRPGRYFVRDRSIALQVLVDVIVGPEVGAEPDLTITNVDLYEGQLRVHVFNNASDMAAPADLTVHWVPVNSGTVVGSRTWEDVQIPSGGSRILQSGEPVDGGIGGLIFVLDPGEAIPDGNRGNNAFETPLRMRVEFLEAFAPHCSESGCSIFDCDSEWVFKLWAGYGPSESDISWTAFNERFPRSDELVACSHEACMGHDSPDSAWVMEGDGRYTFEFDMPAAENLYVKVTGYESDVWTSDDPFASPLYPYFPRDGWGAGAGTHTGYLEAESGCNDALCTECRENNVWVSWRITMAQ